MTSVPALGSRPRAFLAEVIALPSIVARTPLRSWILVFGAWTVGSILSTWAVGELLNGAMRSAGMDAVGSGNAAQLLDSPPGTLLLTAAAIVALAATGLWCALLVRLGRRSLGRSELHGSPAHGARRGIARTLPAVVALTAVGPLVGIGLFSPATHGLTIPPFVSREFLKAPVTAMVWVGLILALAALTMAACVRGIRRFAVDPAVRASAPRLLTVAAVIAAAAAARAAEPHGALFDPALLLSSPVALADPQAWRWLLLGGVQSSLALAAVILLLGRERRGEDESGAAAPTRRRSKRRPAVLAVGLAGAAVLLVGTAAAPAAGAGSDLTVIAHRGYDRGGPENTLAALQAAADAGADVVEVDVMQTIDGGFVAAHDANLLVLGGTDVTLPELTAERASRQEVRMHGLADRVPTLEQYVLRARELDVRLLIELKVTGTERGAPAEDLLAQLRDLDGLEGNMLHSLHPASVRALHEGAGGTPVGLTMAMHAGALPELPADFYVVEQSSITADLVSSVHAAGKPLYAWTVNDASVIRDLRRAGVDGIVTDNVPAAVDLRDRE